MNSLMHVHFGVLDFWTFFLGTVFIVLLPGPNSLYVLSVAAQRGVRQGYLGACGVFTGDLILMVLSACGAASLLKTSPLLFIGGQICRRGLSRLDRLANVARLLASPARGRGGCRPCSAMRTRSKKRWPSA